MRFLILFFIFTFSLSAQHFTQAEMPGVWTVSPKKANGFISFGKDIGKERREKWHILFNPNGKLKVQETGSVYNYEIVNGMLKIYETKVYSRGYEVRQDTVGRYDLMKIERPYEGCVQVKWHKKKIQGLKLRDGIKMCKTEAFPQPVYQRTVDDFNF